MKFDNKQYQVALAIVVKAYQTHSVRDKGHVIFFDRISGGIDVTNLLAAVSSLPLTEEEEKRAVSVLKHVKRTAIRDNIMKAVIKPDEEFRKEYHRKDKPVQNERASRKK